MVCTLNPDASIMGTHFCQAQVSHTSYQFLQRDFAKLMAISDCESASELFLVPESCGGAYRGVQVTEECA